ncbi:MAG: fatty acid desaturase [Pirellulales bacterium]|nr:fatty acid desaturase [Pirellulales bacterium]
MSTIDQHTKISWQKVPVEREILRNLHQKNDWKGLLQAGGFLGLLVLTGTAAWMASDRIFLFLPLAFLHGTFWSFLSPGHHELVHNSMFQTKLLNTLFLYGYGFLNWGSPVMYWASHTRHHKYTLHPPDDLEVELPYDFSLKNFLKTGFVDVWTFVGTVKGLVRLSLGKDEGTPAKLRSSDVTKNFPLESEWQMCLFPREDIRERRRLFNWARVLLIGHVAIATVSICFGLWQVLVLVTFAPFYGRWLWYLCVVPQHAGLQDNVPDFRLCCRTILLNPLLEFVYFHMNYHTEHHMYAAVPCYNLKKLHRIIEPQLPDCPRGLMTTWREMLAIKKKQSIDPGYQYVPALPSARSSSCEPRVSHQRV